MKRLFAIMLTLSLLALCGCGAPAQETEPVPVPTEVPTEAPTQAPEVPTAPAEKNYTVTVIDMNDTPVSGVTVQVNGITCVTNETGVATFSLPVGVYKVTVEELPYGYAFTTDQREFAFVEDVTYLTIYVEHGEVEADESYLEDDAPVEDVPADEFVPEG